MKNIFKSNRLIVPIYINEKLVLDMLAIMEDGFSMVSQVNYTENSENNNSNGIDAGVNTSSLLSKLLKINVSGTINNSSSKEEKEFVSKEKVHTNVSLLSKFITYLENQKILKSDINISEINIGDFIEIEGELQKNPLINYMDLFVDFFRMVDIFSDEAQLGNKTQAQRQKKENNEIAKQIKLFSNELKHSGTIDFILTGQKGTAVLSAQEQYLTNDNISEMIGGKFKVLGKVISVYNSTNEGIDLLRKTTLSILSDEMLNEIFSGLENEEMKQFNLPELVTKIPGPAVIVIPIAIYAWTSTTLSL